MTVELAPGTATGAAARRYVELGKRLPRRDPGSRLPAHPPPKRYPGVPRIPLAGSAWGRLLRATYGPSRMQYAAGRLDGGWLRPVPSGGAYHPAELYVIDAAEQVAYHLDPIHDAASPIPARASDVDGQWPGPGRLVAVTCRVWKNRGTYGDFGYRLGALDVGCVVGQLLVAASGSVRFAFPDDRVDRVLGLDSAVESTYALVDLDLPELPAVAAEHRLPGPRLPEDGLAGERRDLPGIPLPLRHLHGGARRWIGDPRDVPPPQEPAAAGPAVPLPRAAPVPLIEGVARRRSAQALSRDALALPVLAQVLRSAMFAGMPGVDAYVVANRVHGLAPGGYLFRPEAAQLLPVVPVDLRERLQRLAPAIRPVSPSVSGGAVSVFLVGRYEPGLGIVGDRWYRIQNMLGGMLLQSFCLAAAALGLGCRPNLGYPVDDIDRLLRLPPDHTALVHLVIGHVERECGVYDASIGNKGDLDG